MSNILITSFYNILDTEDQEGKKRVTIEYVINAIKTNVAPSVRNSVLLLVFIMFLKTI